MVNIKVCFISNYHKTPFFNEVARKLIIQGVEVFWIGIDRHYMEKLALEWGQDKVLVINRKTVDATQKSPWDFKLNELVFGDRVLKQNYHFGKQLLLGIQKPIYDFILSNQISFVFGELTWAHEILIHRMCNQIVELNCRFLNPHTIRIPNGRFAFFLDEFQSIMVHRSAVNLKGDDAIEIKAVLDSVEPPDYLKMNDILIREKNSFRGLLIRTKKFIFNEFHDDPNDFTRLTKWSTVKRRLKEQIRRFSYRFIKRIEIQDLGDKKFVLYTMHKQPEASIDVIGRYYEDQFVIIRNIWRFLSSDCFLVVKEHSNALGDRGWIFYKELKKYPNILFVNENSSSHDLLKKSLAVFTISGTIAYEAVLLDKPAFTFGPCFFNNYGKCVHLTWSDFRKFDGLESLIQYVENLNLPKSEELTKHVLSSSFPGFINDIFSNPTVMRKENVGDVASAIYEIVS